MPVPTNAVVFRLPVAALHACAASTKELQDLAMVASESFDLGLRWRGHAVRPASAVLERSALQACAYTKLAPRMENSMQSMGQCICLVHAQAIQALEQIAELQPGDPEVAKMLARLHYRLNDPVNAAKVLQVSTSSSTLM